MTLEQQRRACVIELIKLQARYNAARTKEAKLQWDASARGFGPYVYASSRLNHKIHQVSRELVRLMLTEEHPHYLERFPQMHPDKYYIEKAKEKYAMRPQDIKDAAQALDDLEQAKNLKAAFEHVRVLGVVVGMPEDNASDRLHITQATGVNQYTGRGFPEQLRVALDTAYRRWLSEEVEKAQAILAALGVEVD